MCEGGKKVGVSEQEWPQCEVFNNQEEQTSVLPAQPEQHVEGV